MTTGGTPMTYPPYHNYDLDQEPSSCEDSATMHLLQPWLDLSSKVDPELGLSHRWISYNLVLVAACLLHHLNDKIF